MTSLLAQAQSLWQNFPITAPDVSAIAASLALFVVVITFRMNRRLSYNAEKVKVISWCTDQYYQIKKSRSDKTPQLVTDAEKKAADITFFEHIWGLHFAQYHFYELDILPPEIYASWLYLRHTLFQKTEIEKEGWAEAKNDIADDEFISFVNALNIEQFNTASDVLKFLKSKIWKKRQRRSINGGPSVKPGDQQSPLIG